MNEQSPLEACEMVAARPDRLQNLFQKVPFGQAALGVVVAAELLFLAGCMPPEDNQQESTELACQGNDDPCVIEGESVAVVLAPPAEENITQETTTTVLAVSTTTTTTAPPTTTTTTMPPPIEVPVSVPDTIPEPVSEPEPTPIGCEQVVANTLTEVPIPPGWQIICLGPNIEDDARSFVRGYTEIYYGDPRDTDEHMRCVILHEVPHMYQMRLGLYADRAISIRALESQANIFANRFGCSWSEIIEDGDEEGTPFGCQLYIDNGIEIC